MGSLEYEFEENDMNNPHKAQRHHEDSVAFQKRFPTDFNCLEKTVISNPFMLEKLILLDNHDERKFNDSVFEDIKIIVAEGENNSLISGRKGSSQRNYKLMLLSS